MQFQQLSVAAIILLESDTTHFFCPLQKCMKIKLHFLLQMGSFLIF